MPDLSPWLRSQGLRAICAHPNDFGIYRRPGSQGDVIFQPPCRIAFELLEECSELKSA
jgi:hypothetical protein